MNQKHLVFLDEVAHNDDSKGWMSGFIVPRSMFFSLCVSVCVCVWLLLPRGHAGWWCLDSSLSSPVAHLVIGLKTPGFSPLIGSLFVLLSGTTSYFMCSSLSQVSLTLAQSLLAYLLGRLYQICQCLVKTAISWKATLRSHCYRHHQDVSESVPPQGSLSKFQTNNFLVSTDTFMDLTFSTDPPWTVH